MIGFPFLPGRDALLRVHAFSVRVIRRISVEMAL